MKEDFSILIADRNRNIRKFLQRELTAEGYRVQLVSDGREIIKTISVKPPNLLILDLDMPYVEGVRILEHIRKRNLCIPVVIHSFPAAYADHPTIQNQTVFVEKDGNNNNINNLKAAIAKALREHYPHRFTPAQRPESA